MDKSRSTTDKRKAAASTTLLKALASTGAGSRRTLVAAIFQGKVKVNGIPSPTCVIP